MTTPRFRLTDLDLSEISLVPSGDDELAAIVFAKSEPVTKGSCSRKHKAGRTCTSCGAVSKSMPDSKAVYVPAPLGNEFRHNKKRKKKMINPMTGVEKGMGNRAGFAWVKPVPGKRKGFWRKLPAGSGRGAGRPRSPIVEPTPIVRPLSARSAQIMRDRAAGAAPAASAKGPNSPERMKIRRAGSSNKNGNWEVNSPQDARTALAQLGKRLTRDMGRVDRGMMYGTPEAELQADRQKIKAVWDEFQSLIREFDLMAPRNVKMDAKYIP